MRKALICGVALVSILVSIIATGCATSGTERDLRIERVEGAADGAVAEGPAGVVEAYTEAVAAEDEEAARALLHPALEPAPGSWLLGFRTSMPDVVTIEAVRDHHVSDMYFGQVEVDCLMAYSADDGSPEPFSSKVRFYVFRETDEDPWLIAAMEQVDR